jgi:L-ascorbate metabolism protein UlaG (beta-lactamase superfamily)
MILKIKYLGYSAFAIQSYEGVTVVTDPFNDNCGFSLPAQLKADIILVSHNHAAHNCAQAIPGKPAIIQGPGYRELGWVKIRGLKSYHDKVNGEKHGPNTIFCWDMRAVKLCHLGDLGHLPDKELVNQIGPVDVLFLPIGGGTVLGPEEAEKTLKLLNCKYIIPMHYKTKYNSQNFRYTLQDFLEGKKNILPVETKNEFVLSRGNLVAPEKTIVPLEYLEG